ncbi:TPA: hypothetical protein ACPSKE_002396 [Legionella feeleii]
MADYWTRLKDLTKLGMLCYSSTKLAIAGRVHHSRRNSSPAIFAASNTESDRNELAGIVTQAAKANRSCRFRVVFCEEDGQNPPSHGFCLDIKIANGSVSIFSADSLSIDSHNEEALSVLEETLNFQGIKNSIYYMPVQRQRDGYSCGVFALEDAFMLSHIEDYYYRDLETGTDFHDFLRKAEPEEGGWETKPHWKKVTPAPLMRSSQQEKLPDNIDNRVLASIKKDKGVSDYFDMQWIGKISRYVQKKLANYFVYARDLIYDRGLTEEEKIAQIEACSLEGLKHYLNQENRKKDIADKLAPIDKALNDLTQKILTTEFQHQDAKEKACDLSVELTIYRTTYKEHLLEGKIPEAKLDDWFKASCKGAIEGAKLVLSKELGWKVYLQNLLKDLTNKGIKKISFGRYQDTFFSLKSLDGIKEAEESLLKSASEQPQIKEYLFT